MTTSPAAVMLTAAEGQRAARLFTDGHSPRQVADALERPIDSVVAWLREHRAAEKAGRPAPVPAPSVPFLGSESAVRLLLHRVGNRVTVTSPDMPGWAASALNWQELVREIRGALDRRAGQPAPPAGAPDAPTSSADQLLADADNVGLGKLADKIRTLFADIEERLGVEQEAKRLQQERQAELATAAAEVARAEAVLSAARAKVRELGGGRKRRTPLPAGSEVSSGPDGTPAPRPKRQLTPAQLEALRKNAEKARAAVAAKRAAGKPPRDGRRPQPPRPLAGQRARLVSACHLHCRAGVLERPGRVRHRTHRLPGAGAPRRRPHRRRGPVQPARQSSP